MGSFVQAAPLNLLLNDASDIASSFISVDYIASTNVFTVNGTALALDDDSGFPALGISNGTFDLVATILNNGMLINGSFTISGTVATLGFNSNTLLTGNLIALGFNQPSDPLEFKFDTTGGAHLLCLVVAEFQGVSSSALPALAVTGRMILARSLPVILIQAS